MSQRIFSPPSSPTKRKLYGLLSSIVKPLSLRIAYRKQVHFSKSATEHRRRPLSFQAFRNIYYGNRALFSLAVAALLCAPVSAEAVGQTTRVSSGAFPSVSADGRYIAFESTDSNLVPGDSNGTYDVFVHDLRSDLTSRISVTSDGMQGNNDSYHASISADGHYVTFESAASNLVPEDTNGLNDVFVYDLRSGLTIRVSVASDGTESSFGGRTLLNAISADGRYVTFYSETNELVSGDTNGQNDVFVRDLWRKTTSRVSVASDGTQGNNPSYIGQISSDGRFVSFTSTADNLAPGDTNGTYDVFIHDRRTDQTNLINQASDGTLGNSFAVGGHISANGRYVTFSSDADNLVPRDSNASSDVFIRDQWIGKTSRVSVASDGRQGNSHSYNDTISADGRYVTFTSVANNLVPGDTNGTYDKFVHDRSNGQTSRISVASNGTQANSASDLFASISADGRFVAFNSNADNLVAGDTNENVDIFVRDLLLLPNKKADLSVTQSESSDPVVKGRLLTYTVKVKNNGRDPASDVNLTDLVPLEQQLLSAIPSQGSCYKAPITVCRLGRLYPGASAQVRVKLKAKRSGVIRNTVSVNAAPKDLAPYNNSSTISTLIK